MPISSGVQQEAEQEEEEVEVGEVQVQVHMQEFWQQNEEQVVKRRITVSRRPASRMTSEMFRSVLQSEIESYSVPVKVNTTTVAREKRMLTQVAFTEKVISTSPCELQLLQQHFVFDSNEKKVKAGKRRREG